MNTEEEVITQRLVERMNALIEDRSEPAWMRRYHANDNPPLPFPGREGKRRPRIDIEVVFLRGTPRPRFHFEAKRLGPRHPVSKYLGNDGLGCFLTAQYARESDEGGILGYVQSGTQEHWAARIRDSLQRDRTRYRMIRDTQWEEWQVTPELRTSYRTQHHRPSLRRTISVYHTLLLFCVPSIS